MKTVCDMGHCTFITAFVTLLAVGITAQRDVANLTGCTTYVAGQAAAITLVGEQGPPGVEGPPGPRGEVGPRGEKGDLRDYATVDDVIQALQKRGMLLCANTSLGRSRPASSCKQIKDADNTCVSGYYWIGRNADGPARLVYCQMDSFCGTEGGGWTRVAFVNTTDPLTSCPGQWRVINGTRRVCARQPNVACSSAVFSVNDIQYSSVCGRVTGYSCGSPDLFLRIYGHNRALDRPYLDGVSITQGSPRQHLWSYAAAWHAGYDGSSCSGVPFDFVGRNFTADVPPNPTGTWQAVANWDYHLWDPKDCRIKACCHEWFQRDVPLSSDDLEVRLCADQSSSMDEDIYVDLVEVYVR